MSHWKPIIGTGNRYLISRFGTVVSLKNGKPRQLKPQVSKRGYLVVDLYYSGRRYLSTVHRLLYKTFVQDIDSSVFIDHIDGNPLNNSLSNLRACQHRQNMYNSKARSGHSSKYKGVSWCACTKKWRAQLKREEERKSHIGRFKTEEEAAQAYNEVAEIAHGEFARLNNV
jgi:hypothetical protein